MKIGLLSWIITKVKHLSFGGENSLLDQLPVSHTDSTSVHLRVNQQSFRVRRRFLSLQSGDNISSIPRVILIVRSTTSEVNKGGEPVDHVHNVCGCGTCFDNSRPSGNSNSFNSSFIKRSLRSSPGRVVGGGGEVNSTSRSHNLIICLNSSVIRRENNQSILVHSFCFQSGDNTTNTFIHMLDESRVVTTDRVISTGILIIFPVRRITLIRRVSSQVSKVKEERLISLSIVFHNNSLCFGVKKFFNMAFFFEENTISLPVKLSSTLMSEVVNITNNKTVMIIKTTVDGPEFRISMT
mmetsp:Transcript_3635/g.5488  ORF Transcript_3635/g.5488 Transcript_3635/m.5488 type:complete len:296 (-) Transcript_3635:575-1462(-)